MVQVGASAPVLRSGYAWVSSRRNPRDPQCEVIGAEECEGARFVGWAVIDGYRHWAFCGRFDGKRRYFFQLG